MSSSQKSPDTGQLRRLATTVPGVFEIRPKILRDSRGFFLETYHRAKYSALGIADVFVQDNHSQSAKHALRGLHYQVHHSQAKLCRVVEGEALDVVVDVRAGSPTFGRWTSVLLSARHQNQVYIPSGFAHGFVALTESVQFLYKCSDFYAPDDEHGIIWNDPELRIEWGVANPVISSKDARLPRLADIPGELLPKYTVR
jgi:dTDP-4-dehydrorhamnose 3,5-epimerase